MGIKSCRANDKIRREFFYNGRNMSHESNADIMRIHPGSQWNVENSFVWGSVTASSRVDASLSRIRS
jgi:hypothetical protein